MALECFEDPVCMSECVCVREREIEDQQLSTTLNSLINVKETVIVCLEGVVEVQE
jgi:hypothetical protein